MKTYTAADLSFVICAYGESPYLEECIRSLKRQSVKAKTAIMTYTPNVHIYQLAELYGLEVKVNRGESGIAGDWNAALASSDTALTVIAHQDDIYGRDYAASVLLAANEAGDPILIFTDYGERRSGENVYHNRLLGIKRLMLAPLKIKSLAPSVAARRLVLSLGSPICCPSVCYVMEHMPEKLFDPLYKVSLDWDAWERLSRKEGSFVYVPGIHMLHRIHKGSETTKLIEDLTRNSEDLGMYERFWPESIAKLLEHFYSRAEESNRLDD